MSFMMITMVSIMLPRASVAADRIMEILNTNTSVENPAQPKDAASLTGGRVVVLGGTGKNFAAGMSGGIAYVLDENSDLYLRANKEIVALEAVTSKADVMELKAMITEHVEATGSEKGKKVLEHFSEYLPKFKKVIPNDYKMMQNMIVRMEEKGFNSEEAQIEAFYAATKNA